MIKTLAIIFAILLGDALAAKCNFQMEKYSDTSCGTLSTVETYELEFHKCKMSNGVYTKVIMCDQDNFVQLAYYDDDQCT